LRAVEYMLHLADFGVHAAEYLPAVTMQFTPCEPDSREHREISFT